MNNKIFKPLCDQSNVLAFLCWDLKLSCHQPGPIHKHITTEVNHTFLIVFAGPPCIDKTGHKMWSEPPQSHSGSGGGVPVVKELYEVHE